MTDRHPRIAQAVLMQHRENPMSHSYGWAIEGQGARTMYLRIDGNGGHQWTPNQRDAELFLTKDRAERHIRDHMAGSAKPVELRW